MSQRMPSVFFGHGNPMNTLLRNPYTEQWAAIGTKLPKPKAILSVSAHWYIQDAAVTISTSPKTIHDFGGFPRELYQVQYPAPGDPDLAARVQKLLAPLPVRLDERALGAGSWDMVGPVPSLSACRRSCGSAEHRRNTDALVSETLLSGLHNGLPN